SYFLTMFLFHLLGQSQGRGNKTWLGLNMGTSHNSASTIASSRRQWLSGLLVTAGVFAFTSESRADSSNGLSHNAEAIHQEVAFKASPQRIYDALIDSKQFQQVQLLSGTIAGIDLRTHPAQISRE